MGVINLLCPFALSNSLATSYTEFLVSDPKTIKNVIRPQSALCNCELCCIAMAHCATRGYHVASSVEFYVRQPSTLMCVMRLPVAVE